MAKIQIVCVALFALVAVSMAAELGSGTPLVGVKKDGGDLKTAASFGYGLGFGYVGYGGYGGYGGGWGGWGLPLYGWGWGGWGYPGYGGFGFYG